MATASELVAAFKNLTGYKAAAELIEACGAKARDEFLKFSVDEAAKDGISIEFGGYAVDKDEFGKFVGYASYAHTIKNTIFMPHPSVRTMTTQNAMTWFLFETRNAMRAKKYCELYRDAAKGIKLQNSFVYFMAEYEARGGLEVGKLWQQLITTYKKNPSSGQSSYYYNLYQASPNWEKDSKQLGKAMETVLNEPFDSGKYKGKTRRQSYAEVHFQHYAVTNKAYYSHPTRTCAGSDLKLATTTTGLPVGLA